MDSLEQLSEPRSEYRLAPIQQFIYLALAAMLSLCAGFSFKLATDPVGRDFVLLAGFALLIAALILTLQALRSRLLIEESRIEVRSALCNFTATRNEIEGFRTIVISTVNGAAFI